MLEQICKLREAIALYLTIHLKVYTDLLIEL